MNALRTSRLPLVATNDARAIPCQQSLEACDQIARVHIEGTVDDNVWDVDVCPEHATLIVRHYGYDNFGGTQTVNKCDICLIAIEPVTVTRCGKCLGCVDGSRCELPDAVFCAECEADNA